MNFKNKNKKELLTIIKKLLILNEKNKFYLEHKNNLPHDRHLRTDRPG